MHNLCVFINLHKGDHEVNSRHCSTPSLTPIKSGYNMCNYSTIRKELTLHDKRPTTEKSGQSSSFLMLRLNLGSVNARSLACTILNNGYPVWSYGVKLFRKYQEDRVQIKFEE